MYVEKLKVGPLGTNCYIIINKSEKLCAVIDPGADSQKISCFINSNNLTLTHIIITHSHSDHIDALDDLSKHFPIAKIIISEIDNCTLNSNSYTLSDMLGTNAPVTRANVTVKDNDIISVCGYDAKIISTPGHTPGSICIYFENYNILFSGDTLFYESVGRTDFPGGSYKSISVSIKDKLFILPDKTIVYPGHNSETTIIHEKESNFYI